MEYKSVIGSYQWIGAGRDTDTHLVALCRHWTDRRDEMTAQPIKEEEGLVGDRQLMASPPPPRCPTQWLVQLSSPEEREVFRDQVSCQLFDASVLARGMYILIFHLELLFMA